MRDRNGEAPGRRGGVARARLHQKEVEVLEYPEHGIEAN
jgi:hypothetical protein